MADWKGSTLEQVARHVMVVIAVCMLIDVSKKTFDIPKGVRRESQEMDNETENKDAC